jgi:hypothetical protein
MLFPWKNKHYWQTPDKPDYNEERKKPKSVKSQM